MRAARLIVPLFVLCSSFAPAWGAGASAVRVELLVDGRVQREHYKDGTPWVEARKGKEYSIRLSNDSGERVAVALAVDGLNPIDGQHTSALAAAKWVLGPWEAITVDGWQVSGSRARRFVFTAEEQSYGAFRGDTRNLGNIEAVVFAERRVERRDNRCCREDYGDAASGAPAPSSRAESKQRDGRAAPAAEAEDDYAATGYGRSVRNDVSWTTFDLDPSPRGSVRLRYGYREELVAMGVLPAEPDPLTRRQQGGGFAPDPGYACCR